VLFERFALHGEPPWLRTDGHQKFCDMLRLVERLRLTQLQE
jgi:hypothetical protein